jgi:putative ABC transport system permease protein
MISMLDRKLLRDLGQIKSQAFAIALVMAAGVAMFIMALSALFSLSGSQRDYYVRYRFAEIFATAKRVPLNLVARLEEVPGVARVYPRIVAQVSLDVPGMNEPAMGRFISVPDHVRPALNDLYLIRGRMLDPDRPQEILASKSFVEAHQLELGSTIRGIINGKRQDLTVVGVALTPEYIIQIQPGSLLPDHRRFGVFWMNERQMAAAFEMSGAFNDVSFLMERGANEQRVIGHIDRLLEPYGCTGAYGRAQQTSHAYISDEIRQLSTMALIAPTIFLGVAAFLLNVVLARVVGLQREQIAALKAFGYSKSAIGWHYLKMVLLIALVGAVLGTLFGYWLARGLTRIYSELYQFPTFEVMMPPRVVLGALTVSFAAASLGALAAVRRAVSLPPAEAMRPEPPPKYGPTLIERIGLARFVPQIARMILRQIERKPIKSLTAILGVAMSVAILMLGSFSLDAIRYIINFQFRLAQRQQVTVSFVEPTSSTARFDLQQLPGVTQVQPFRAVATNIRHGHRWRRVAVMGFDGEGEMFRLLNTDEQPFVLPEEGIVLNDKLAQILGVTLGESVTLSVLEGSRPIRDLIVTGIITEYGGVNAYMNRRALQRLMNESELISGAFLGTEADVEPSLFARLKQIPQVGGVMLKRAMLQSFEDTIAENILMMRTFNILFSIVIAVGVVYNSARISLAEQSRELATLRVIGFTQYEVSLILLGELAILTFAAIPLGWLIGYGLAAILVTGLDTEIYRIPLIIERTTYGFAALVVVVASGLSGWVVLQRIRQLDLIAVLKTRE